MNSEGPNQGGEPQELATCTDCREIYPAQWTSDGDLRPIGLEDGSCTCGNPEFQSVVED